MEKDVSKQGELGVEAVVALCLEGRNPVFCVRAAMHVNPAFRVSQVTYFPALATSYSASVLTFHRYFLKG